MSFLNLYDFLFCGTQNEMFWRMFCCFFVYTIKVSGVQCCLNPIGFYWMDKNSSLLMCEDKFMLWQYVYYS